jgi:cyclase
MGDDFVTYGFPFVDVGSGGSVSGMISGCEKVMEMLPPDVKIIPGHGPISATSDLRNFVDMLKDTREIVARAVKDGKNPEQMKKDHILSKYESLAKGFIKTDAWIDVLYADVMHKTTGALFYRNHGHSGESSLSHLN